MMIPNSLLTISRPDIWSRGLVLATNLTGYEYTPKLPLPDGKIYACGGGGWKPPSDSRQEKINEHKRLIEYWEEVKKRHKEDGEPDDYSDGYIKENQDALNKLLMSLAVFVPEGAMEWLLHEVGHWVAATPEERLLLNYGIPLDLTYDDKMQIKTIGFGYQREWQAWAFEEIVLAPFGPAREFCAPTHRGGVGYSKAEIPQSAFRHIENQLHEQQLDIEGLRNVWGSWIEWGKLRGPRAPWLNAS